jgi:HEAT repeat protein
VGTASLVILAVGGAVVGLTALLWFVGRHDARWKRIARGVWSDAAGELGLERSDPPGGRGLAGAIEGFEVSVQTDKNPVVVRARLKGGGRISKDVRMDAAKFFPDEKIGPVVSLGDEDFDALVRVAGREDEVLAALGVEGRAAAKAFIDDGGKVSGGDLEVALDLDEDRVVRGVRRMVALAKSLAVGSVAEALLENATKDPSAAVRRRNLVALTRSKPDSKEAIWGLQAALRDLDPVMRFFAAEQLADNPEGRDTLVKLVENRALPEALRATALERLAEVHPYPTIAPVVAWALSAESVKVRCAAVWAVGAGNDGSKIEALASVASLTPPPELGEALAESLGQLGGPRAEDALISLLSHEAREVKEAAATALGKTGSIRAVEPLLQWAKTGAVGSVARDAVRSIQARLGDAGAGRLSVVDSVGAEGAVSLENPIPDEPEKAGS